MTPVRARQLLTALREAPPERKESALNDILTDLYSQLDAIRTVGGVLALEWLTFDTGTLFTPTDRPFANGNLRVSCPFSPVGVVVLALERTRPAGQFVPTTAVDVKWRYAAGPDGDGALTVDYITGLQGNSSYRVRLGVVRG